MQQQRFIAKGTVISKFLKQKHFVTKLNKLAKLFLNLSAFTRFFPTKIHKNF